MKTRPNYATAPFASIEAAKARVDAFIAWNNDEHRHSAIDVDGDGQLEFLGSRYLEGTVVIDHHATIQNALSIPFYGCPF